MELLFRTKIQSELDIQLAIYKATQQIGLTTFNSVQAAKLKTAISELGYNIIKYAQTGMITMYRIDTPQKGLCIKATDQGPGIADVQLALLDNYSTGGTLGLGLPGVKRMMDDFSITSELGKGTEVSIVLYENN